MTTKPPFLSITKDLLVELGGWDLLQRAQAMVQAGRATQVCYEPPLLTATIQVNGRPLLTRLKLGSRLADVENLCTCRQAKEEGTICPHVIAAGWAYFQQNQGSPTPLPSRPSSTQHRTVVKKDPSWRYVLSGSPQASQAAYAEPLQLTLLLPLSFPRAIQESHLQLILQAAVHASSPEQPSQSWDTVPKDLDHLYVVSEEDQAVLRFLEIIHGVVGDPPPTVTALPRGSYALFFEILAEHPRVWIGKKERLRLIPLTSRPRLDLALQPQGALTLHLHDIPSPTGKLFFLGKNRIPWAWTPSSSSSPATLARAFFLPGSYGDLLQKNLTLASSQIPSFFTQDLPALRRYVEVVKDKTLDQLHFQIRKPSVRLYLEGSLSGLILQLHVDYPGQSILLEPKASRRPDNPWQSDSETLGSFWKRDLDKEQALCLEMQEAGFSPSPRKSTHWVLTREYEVGRFLANTLPRWRAQWSVDFGPRFQELWPRLDYLQPEVTLQPSGEDWLNLELDTGAQGTSLSPSEIQSWLQKGQSHTRLSNNRVLLFPTQAWQEVHEVLCDANIQQSPGQSRIHSQQVPYLLNAIQEQGWAFSSKSAQKNFAEEAPDPLPSLSETLRKTLRPYQQQGVRWLSSLAHQKWGGVLADEMGLGKTLQVLAFLTSWLPHQSGPALVVCPTSLIENWRSEAERFTPDLRVLLLHGPQRKKDFARMDQHDLIITSYALLRRDAPSYPIASFATVILDEAQHIKNRASQNAQSAKALSTSYRFALTGTPLENSLFDLWSLYDFVLPGYLGNASDFAQRYEIPITQQQDSAAQKRLRHRLRPFFLRRIKEDVARDLPEKLEQTAFCELTSEQASVYQAILDQGRRLVFEGSGRSGGGKNRMAVLTTLLRLRQAACDLRLLPASTQSSPHSFQQPSAKLDLCLELLNEAIDGGHRVLIFSQFVQLLGFLQQRLEEEKISFCYLDGSTLQRHHEVERFQKTSTIPAFLISLKAGGTGLNLTAADTVLHLDPWWNPQVEDQATARAHRIGQEKPVTSYRLIARKTVEEKILQLQQRKRDLFLANVGNEELFIESLKWEEIQELFD